MKKRIRYVALLLIPVAFFMFLIYQMFVLGKVAAPIDLLPGAQFPWLNYRDYGYSTIAPVKNPILSDVISQTIPWQKQILDNTNDLTKVWWDYNSLSGLPYIGTSYLVSIFNPFVVIFAFLAKSGITLQNLLAFTQLPLVLVASYLFLRTYKLNRYYAMVGGVIFSIAGLMTSWFELAVAGYALAWVILIWTVIRSKYEDRNILYIALLTLLLITSASAQISFFGGLVALVFLLARRNWQEELKLVLGFIIGACLSAYIIIPTLHVFQISIRNSDGYIKEYNHGLVSLSQYLTVGIAPDFFGNPAKYNYKGEWMYHESASYLGALILGFWASSLYANFKQRKLSALNCMALVGWFMLISSPFTRWLYQLPIPIIGSSSASRLLFIVLPLTATSALLELERKSKSGKSLESVVNFTILAAYGTVLYAIFRIGQAEFNYFLDTQNPSPIPLIDWLPSALLGQIVTPQLTIAITSLRNTLIPLLSLVFVSFFALVFKRKYPGIIVFAILNVTLLGLFSYFLTFNPLVRPNQWYPVTPEITKLQEFTKSNPGRVEFFGSAILPPGVWVLYGLQSASGYFSIYPKRYGEFVGLINNNSKVENPGRYLSLDNPNSRWYDFLGSRYALLNTDSFYPWMTDDLAHAKATNEDLKMQKVYQNKNMAIYENTQAQENKTILSKYRVVSDDDFWNIARDPNFDPKTEVLLSAAPPSGTKKLMVISNTYDEGWHAKAKGVEVPVIRANYAFQAVPLTDDQNDIEMTYTPPGLQLGVIISGSTLLMVIAYLVFLKVKKPIS